MSDACDKCQSLVTTRKPGISCDGFCRNSYNFACVSFSPDVLKYKNQLGCLWFCPCCLASKIDASAGRDVVHDSLQGALEKLEDVFSAMKSELVSTMNSIIPCSSNASVPSYSAVIKKIGNLLIIKPKSEVFENIKHLDENVPITKTKHSDGGDFAYFRHGCVLDENLSEL